MRKAVLFLVSFLLVISCADEKSGSSGGGVGSSAHKVPSEYRGQWIYTHSTQKVYLGATTNLTLEYTDRNIVTVKRSNYTDQHLVRAGSSNVQLHGTVEGLTTGSITQSVDRAFFAPIGGMDVVLKNLNDPNIKGQTKTDNNGDFSMGGIPGGSYEVSAGNTQVNTELDGTDNDIGIITVIKNSGCNFKSSLVMNDSFFYGNYTKYSGSVRIENVGRTECLGLSYNITANDTSVDNFTFTNKAGTILPGKSKDIPITISFKFLDTAEKYITLNIELGDVNGRKWNDRVRLRVFRSAVTVNFNSQHAVRGHIIVPGQGPEGVSTNMTLPEMPGKEYLIILSNPDLSYESFYSIGINVPANNANTLTDNVDGLNNDTNSAKVLNMNDKADGYLHKGDIDTFKIAMSSGAAHKAADLSVDAVGGFYETTGNGDGILNKGETAYFNIGIKNSGTFTAKAVATTLYIGDPYITVTKRASCPAYDIAGSEKRDTSGNYSGGSSYLTANSSSAYNCFTVSVLNTAPDNHTATVTATMTDQFGNTWVNTFSMNLAPVSASLSVDRMGAIYETTGNGDGILNKGETAYFNIGINNSGSSSAKSVATTLYLDDPYLTVTKRASCPAYDIAGSEKRDTSGNYSGSGSYLTANSSSAYNCFTVSVLSTAPDNHTATVTATMTDHFGNTWTDSFDITVQPVSASLSVDRMGAIYETTGNGDGMLNKGETAYFNIGIMNSGPSAVRSVATALYTDDPYITVTKRTTCPAYDIAGSEKRDTGGNYSSSSSYLTANSSFAYNCFTISVLNTAPDNHTATVTATMTDHFGNTWADTVDITVHP